MYRHQYFFDVTSYEHNKVYTVFQCKHDILHNYNNAVKNDSSIKFLMGTCLFH